MNKEELIDDWNIGDKVRCVSNVGTGSRISCGTIYQILNKSYVLGKWYIDIVDNFGSITGWGADGFEKINKIKKKRELVNLNHMFLKDFKFLCNQCDLITVCNSPVSYKIDDERISFNWTGLETGTHFTAFLDPESMKGTEFINDNTVAVPLYSISANSIIYEWTYKTHFSFWYKIGVTVVNSFGLKSCGNFSKNRQDIKKKKSKKSVDNIIVKN